jgi:hypothetical protein
VLPVDVDNEIDLCSDELAEILSDSPIQQMKQSRVTERAAVAKDEVDGSGQGNVGVEAKIRMDELRERLHD